MTSRGCAGCYEEELLSEPLRSTSGPHPGHGEFVSVTNSHGHLSVEFVPCEGRCCQRKKGH